MVVAVEVITTAGINQITVNGKTLVLEQPGIYVGTWTTMRSGDTALYKCCGKYSDVRFGAYEGGPNRDAYFFYNGNPTKSMPQSGPQPILVTQLSALMMKNLINTATIF